MVKIYNRTAAAAMLLISPSAEVLANHSSVPMWPRVSPLTERRSA
jgi:hypothetical protein